MTLFPIGGPEREALVESAERYVRDHYDTSAAGSRGASRERWLEMAGLGWLGIAVPEEAGGLGLGHALSSALVEALAPGVMPEPVAAQLAVGSLLAAATPAPARDAVLAPWLAGELIVSLAHREQHGAMPCGGAPSARLEPAGAGWRLGGRKTAVLDAAVADAFLVSAFAGDAIRLACVPREADGVTLHVEPSFDGRSVGDLVLDEVTVDAGACLEVEAAALDEAVLVHGLLLAAEDLGLARALLGLTHDYLVTREQFGTRLADLQLLQHRLVDMHMAVTRLESQLEIARFKAAELGVAAAAPFIAAARAQAGSVAREVGQEAVQLHGAIGVTDELVVGHYYKRITANDLVLGRAGEWLRRYPLDGAGAA
ncbi:MAG: acyl-CoA dehydrogenase family protein [Gammaproteobacteria bacterium]